MGISTVISATGAAGEQYRNLSNAATTLASLHLAPVDIASAAAQVGSAETALDALAAGITTMQAGLAVVEAVGKKVPVVGSVLAGLSLGTGLLQMQDQLSETNSIKAETALGVLADVLAISAVIAGLALTGPVGAAAVIGLSALSAGATLISLDPGIADNIVYQEQLSELDMPLDEYRVDGLDSVLDPSCNDSYRQAITPPRRDPLAIDLDGDGIETAAIPTDGSSPVLFDHNADGIRTGTGWVTGDDAWLVMDRDGNGNIDTGRELFGVDTEIVDAATGRVRNAGTGFEALTAQDDNGDKVIDTNDAAFSELRLWRDLNQDGASQANELLTLEQQGIESISLVSDGKTTDLGNGNTVTGSAKVTYTDGGETEVDGVGLGGDAGNLNLSSNPFSANSPTPFR